MQFFPNKVSIGVVGDMKMENNVIAILKLVSRDTRAVGDIIMKV